MRPLNPLFSLSRGFFALGVLTCFGAATDSLPSRESVARAGVAAAHGTKAEAWQATAHPNALHSVSPDIRFPRSMRQPCERSASGVAEIEGVTAARLLVILGEDTHRPFFARAARACPLAGHRFALLRPPSLLAG